MDITIMQRFNENACKGIEPSIIVVYPTVIVDIPYRKPSFPSQWSYHTPKFKMYFYTYQ